MLVTHFKGILNYSDTKVRCGVVEAVNGNIRMLINRGRAAIPISDIYCARPNASQWPTSNFLYFRVSGRPHELDRLSIPAASPKNVPNIQGK